MDWVESNPRRIHGCFHPRSAHGGPGHEGYLGAVSLNYCGPAGCRQVRPGPRVDYPRRVQDLETAHERFMTMVGIRVVCLVHDVEACPHVRLEHPLFGAGQVAPVVGMEVLGVGYDGFQIAESDIRVLKEIQGWGERRVRVRPRYIGIAQKNHLDVAHCNLLLSGSPGYCSVCQAVEIVCRGILTLHYSPRQSESA